MRTYHPIPFHLSKQRAAEILSKGPWAADNGCYSQPAFFTVDGYLMFLSNHVSGLNTCLFATAPDVVGNAVETWARSREVLPVIRKMGYKAALVAQDGIESLTIP